MRTSPPLAALAAALSASRSTIGTSRAFSPSAAVPAIRRRRPPSPPSAPPRRDRGGGFGFGGAGAGATATALRGGAGVADAYSWTEEQFEIEVRVAVPPRTSAGDVRFRCSSDSIDLRLLNRPDEPGGNGERVLLDGSRKVRGKICVDGTFWSIEGNPEKERQIAVTIEKHFAPVSSSGGTQTFDTLTGFDWGGLYPNDEDEVSYRKYDEAEELDVREYAAGLGVDIDSIDMR